MKTSIFYGGALGLGKSNHGRDWMKSRGHDLKHKIRGWRFPKTATMQTASQLKIGGCPSF